MDAQSWIGFEHRIQERRFRALLETIAAASARGDGVSARVALEEARELRPDAPELADVEARVALLPVVVPAAGASRFFTSRTFNAAALLLVGIALLTALDAFRSGTAPVPEAESAAAPVLAPVVDVGPVGSAPAGTPVFDAEAREPEAPPVVEEPVVAVPVSDRPEPADTVVGTAGSRERANLPPPAPEPEAERPVLRPALLVEPAADPTPPRPEPEPLPRTEVRDDLVVLPAPQPRREAIVAAPVLSRAARGPALVPPTSVATGGTVTGDAAAARAAAAVISDETLVSSVLNRYARAYDALDASAAREVWPTVNERALAKAFAGLESQQVTFDNCNIDVRGEIANASCRGLASYVGKVGSRQPRTEPMRWTFELRREGEAWKIESAQIAVQQ